MERSGGCNDGGAIRLQRGVIGAGLDRPLRHQAEEPPCVAQWDVFLRCKPLAYSR